MSVIKPRVMIDQETLHYIEITYNYVLRKSLLDEIIFYRDFRDSRIHKNL